MMWPSLLRRESMTLFSRSRQKGHFISGHFLCSSMYFTTSWTVRIFSASSSEISMSYSSSSAMTSSTMSSESAPRSSMNDASGVTSPSLTPSCSQMISRTLASTADAIPTLLSLNVEAAVDPDDLTGDVARFTASQEPNHNRHLAHR